MKGALQHQPSSRPHELPCNFEAGCAAGAIYNDIKVPLRQVGRSRRCRNALPLKERPPFRMATHHLQRAARQPQDLRHQQSELAIADYRDPIGWA